MKMIFNRRWVENNLKPRSGKYWFGDESQDIAEKLQNEVEQQLGDYYGLSAAHDADQAVIEALTNDLVATKIELARLRVETQAATIEKQIQTTSITYPHATSAVDEGPLPESAGNSGKVTA